MTLTHARTKTPNYPKVNMPSFFLFKAFMKTTRSLPKLAGSFLSFKSFCLHVWRTQTVPTWLESQAAAQLVAAPVKGRRTVGRNHSTPSFHRPAADSTHRP